MSLPDPIIETLPYRPSTTYAPVTVTSGDEPLTKRERFAMAAMQGICANPNYLQFDGPDFARLARIAADALVAEMEATPTP